jgi:hypothetical protein
MLQTPHSPRPETALWLQKPSNFNQQALPPTFGGGMQDARQGPPIPAGVNGYHGPSEDTQHGIAPGQRDIYAPSPHAAFNNDRFVAPPMTGQGGPAPMGPGDAEFPPYDLLYGLVDLFFKHIYPWCPILHRQTTLTALFGPDSSLDEPDKIILHAIVATTLRFSVDPRLTADKREFYHRTSKEKVLLYGIENSSVKSLQALVILSLDVVGCSNGPPGWNMLALITRSVVQLGLSLESYSPMITPQYASIYTLRAVVLPEPGDWIEEESRRRLFWMVYLICHDSHSLRVCHG